jgi:diphthamide synthase (EF-2-diphthine--ammonia ligase)
MIAAGVKTRLSVIDTRKLDRSFVGRELDAALLRELPHDVDPCGENGEFHTFVSDGPMFRTPLQVETGEIVERDPYVYIDIRICDSTIRDSKIQSGESAICDWIS